MALGYCKCGCGQMLETTTSYSIKLPTNKKLYFVNADHYGKWKENAAVGKTKVNEEELSPIYDLVIDIIGKKLDTKTMLWKYYVQWKKIADKNTLLYYLKSEKWNLQKIFQKKDIYTAYASLQYLNGIINNNLPNYKIPEDTEVKTNYDINMYRTPENKTVPKFGVKKTLEELEQEYDG